MLLHDLFAAAAARHAGQLAVDVSPGEGRPQRERTSYRELEGMVARIALALSAHVTRECVVAVLLPRESARLYAAQIGIMQAGAAYACLDASFPDAHMDFIVRDSAAVAVLTDRASAARVAGCGVPVLLIEDCLRLPEPAKQPRPSWLSPSSLAYVIYTSGTTGKPKGVLIEHRGVVNLITAGVARFSIGPGDRCAQGSSAAYDSSVEETWLALAAGATVVMLDDATVRLGPDLVAWLRRERVTVFCPPPTLLRAMDCSDPRRELPDLRLVYVGGEAMPPDLTDLWGGALWLENGYGPTECTVTVVRGRLLPGKPVIIGEPVPGHQALLLDERNELVAAGEAGELCLAGPGLARGYLGRPELTAEKFPLHPRFGRIYRTGDLARLQPDGQLVCLGRIDAQVKIRGYRIELEAVEAALAQCDGVREAACRVQTVGGVPTLAAFLIASDPAQLPDLAAVERRLRAELPDYMVPARYAFLQVLPRTVGGKLDRRALPDAPPSAGNAAGSAVDEGGSIEQRIAHAFASCLGGAAVGEQDDFFLIGGDSLRAAQVISKLRRKADTAALAVRDLYETRTVAALAARARHLGAAKAQSARVAPPRGNGHPWFATLVHLTWLSFALFASSGAAYLVGFVALPALAEAAGLAGTLALVPLFGVLIVFAYAFATLWFAVWVKELLIGRYRPCSVPVWSALHIRHWLVVRAASLVPWPLLHGTALHTMALRAFGARIGKRVYLHRGVQIARGGWDLLTIEDDAVLGREVHLDLVELDDGRLSCDEIRIGARAIVDVRGGVGRGAVLGEDSFVAALAHVPANARVGAGEVWDGAPARKIGARSPGSQGLDGPAWRISLHALSVVAGRTLLAPLFSALLLLGLFAVARRFGFSEDDLANWIWHDGAWSRPEWAWIAVAASVAVVPLQLLVGALLLRVSPKVPAGVAPLWSPVAFRAWLRMEIVEAAGIWLSGTLFWPVWLRLAGARIGRNSEVSTILDVLPEHLQIGADSFLADGIYLGSPRLQAGAVAFGPVQLGDRTFLGNHVVIHVGQKLPDDLLIGVSTVADDRCMKTGTSWFGAPPLQLPRREVITMDARLTHRPSLVRRVNRLFWEGLRFLLPVWPLYLSLWWFDAAARATAAPTVLSAISQVVLATLGVVVALTMTVLVTKWLLLGKVKPGQHALWSCWASRWDFHYVLWQRYGRGLLAQMDETLMLSWFLRAIGMRIGKGCVLGEGFAQVVDPDMITLDDGCTVHALFQAHSFEDRVLKIDHVRIGRNATVARGAVVLYGADIGDDSHVAAHAVVMKHEVLPPGRRYGGAPLTELTEPAPQLPVPRPRGPITAERDPSLDVARGLAVLGMVWMHFVPADSGSAFFDGLAAAIEGKAATLFAVLAGMTWALQAEHRYENPQRLRSFLVRRTLAMVVAGALFWRLVWPTEIVLPFALMLPCVALLWSRRKGPLVGAAAIVMGLMPLVTHWFGHYAATDWRDDGMHLANLEFGWATLRYFLFDGSYPLLPWLCFPLLGASMVAGGHTDRARDARWVALGLPMALLVQQVSSWAAANAESIGAAAPLLQVTWPPTSLPFVLQNASWAIVVIGALSWWRAVHGLPRLFAPIAMLGRASLTNYVLHILLVFAPMRIWWPDEGWSLGVGVAAALGYVVFAMLASAIWFQRFRRGPLEALLARVSGD